MGVAVTSRLQALGWTVLPEVTFQHFGERGSIDLLGVREDRRAVCVVELKSLLRSYEETQRRPDVKRGSFGKSLSSVWAGDRASSA
jgi:hypothetical protein